jgi:hypothetical protein
MAFYEQAVAPRPELRPGLGQHGGEQRAFLL